MAKRATEALSRLRRPPLNSTVRDEHRVNADAHGASGPELARHQRRDEDDAPPAESPATNTWPKLGPLRQPGIDDFLRWTTVWSWSSDAAGHGCCLKRYFDALSRCHQWFASGSSHICLIHFFTGATFDSFFPTTSPSIDLLCPTTHVDLDPRGPNFPATNSVWPGS